MGINWISSKYTNYDLLIYTSFIKHFFPSDFRINLKEIYNSY